MITASFYSNADERRIALSVKGHAGQAERGKDIVCAAASILTYTLAQIVIHYAPCLEGDPTILLENGDTLITCRCADEETYIKVLTALEHTRVGFLILTQSNAQYVRVIDG